MGKVERIGAHTLYLGDAKTVLPILGAVDHIITDPPYGEALHAHHDARAKSGRSRDGSNRQELGYSALSLEEASALAALFDQVSSGWIAWMTDSDLAIHIRKELSKLGRTTFAPLPFFHAGRSVRLSGDGPCSWTDWIVVARTKAQNKWGTLPGGYIAGEGWNDKQRMGGKPTRLMRQLVTHYSREGETVCDPFMGAGTTGVACVQEGRKFIGVEIDPEAFDLSCKRIEEAQRQGDLFVEAA